MDRPLTVACVYKTGAPDDPSPWRGTYIPECVYALRNMVANNLTYDHRFVCLTDDHELACETIPLEHGWRGWWSKIELFRPGIFEGRVLYFDLDTFINKNIDILFDIPGDFLMIDDLFYRNRPMSGVMRWDGDHSHIYRHFLENGWGKHRKGDQTFIGELANPTFFQDHVGHDFIKSFKKGGQGEDLKQTPVVCFHGEPKPHDSDGWIREYWESKL